jgi:hypothetical protein
MSLEALRAIERAHAVVAWLATIAALLAAVRAHGRDPGRRASLAPASLGALLLLVACASGLLLDEGYRSRLRQRLFVASPAMGWLFERKLHLAFGALLLAITGVASLLGGRRAHDVARGEATRRSLARAATLALTSAALLALAASIAGALVARRTMF